MVNISPSRAMSVAGNIARASSKRGCRSLYREEKCPIMSLLAEAFAATVAASAWWSGRAPWLCDVSRRRKWLRDRADRPPRPCPPAAPSSSCRRGRRSCGPGRDGRSAPRWENRPVLQFDRLAPLGGGDSGDREAVLLDLGFVHVQRRLLLAKEESGRRHRWRSGTDHTSSVRFSNSRACSVVRTSCHTGS